MAAWLDTISTHWFWLALGFVCVVAEFVARGRYLMWVGFAALIIGVADYFLPITLAYQVAMFVILSVLSVFAGKKFSRKDPLKPEMPN